MPDFSVIDADGHVRESIVGMREFLEPRWQRRNLFPNDAWDRDLRGKLGAKPEGPEDQDCMWAACTSRTLRRR
jgi:hypothetical protein